MASIHQSGQDRNEEQVHECCSIHSAVVVGWARVWMEEFFSGFCPQVDPVFQNHHLETCEPTMEVTESYIQRYNK